MAAAPRRVSGGTEWAIPAWATASREAVQEPEREPVPDDINEDGTEAEQPELTLSSTVPESEAHSSEDRAVLELPGIPAPGVIVKRYHEPWSALLLLAATYLDEHFRFILALLVAAFLLWFIRDAQAVIIFR